jgi:predicted phage tail protein
MMTVMLYGDLGAKFGKVHKYAAKSAAECVRAMCATLPGFREYFAPNYYRVLRGGKEVLDEKSARDPQSSRESVRIIPVVTGAKSGLFGIVLGALLIWFSAGLAIPAIGLTASTVASIGWSLVIGGVSQILFGQDAPDNKAQSYEAAENRPSYAFSGAVNTIQQGNPVALCYGKLIVGSQVISAGLSAQEN